MSSKVMLRCVRHLERISRCFLLPWGTSVFFCPVEGKSCGSITATAVYLKIISQAGVEAEMEAAGAAARSGGGVRVAATQRLVDLSGEE